MGGSGGGICGGCGGAGGADGGGAGSGWFELGGGGGDGSGEVVGGGDGGDPASVSTAMNNKSASWNGQCTARSALRCALWALYGLCLALACSAAAFLAACFAGVGPCTFFSRRVKATSSSTWSRARATLKFVEHAEARGTARGGSYVCTSLACASASFGVVVSMATAGVSSPTRSSNWPRTKAAGVAACISRLPRTGLAGLRCEREAGPQASDKFSERQPPPQRFDQNYATPPWPRSQLCAQRFHYA